MKRLPIGIQDNKYMMEADQGDGYTDYETVISVPVPLILSPCSGARGFYHSIILTMLWAAGINVRAEELSNLGRTDLIMEYEQDTYIMELKKQPVQRSIEQIKEKNYAGRYTNPLFFVGIEIDDEKRNLGEYLIEEV